jgi:hypothetical protein
MSKTTLLVSKHCCSPNCEIPDALAKVNYKEFKAAFKATQERRAKQGKLVLPNKFNFRIK